MLIKVDNYKIFNNKKNRKLIINFHKSLKNKSKKFLYCFSGGGLIIINNKYIPVIKRSKLAPTNRNKLSTLSGKSDSLKEIYNPLLLKREIFEELSFVKDNKIINFINNKENNFLNNSVNIKKYNYLKKFIPELSKRYSNFKLSKDYKNNCDEIIINYNSQRSKKIKCLFHISKNKEVNVLFIYNLKIDIKNLYIYDTEFMDKPNKVKPRDVYILDRLNNDKYNSKFITLSKKKKISYTHHLQSIINKLKKL